ncbi:MAG: response regulator transcription factor [Gammaproteobacteria bacterium]
MGRVARHGGRARRRGLADSPAVVEGVRGSPAPHAALARVSGITRIARTMEISHKTVEQHCEHLMQKLDIHDRVELARFAIREGLLEP